MLFLHPHTRKVVCSSHRPNAVVGQSSEHCYQKWTSPKSDVGFRTPRCPVLQRWWRPVTALWGDRKPSSLNITSLIIQIQISLGRLIHFRKIAVLSQHLFSSPHFHFQHLFALLFQQFSLGILCAHSWDSKLSWWSPGHWQLVSVLCLLFWSLQTKNKGKMSDATLQSKNKKYFLEVDT